MTAVKALLREMDLRSRPNGSAKMEQTPKPLKKGKIRMFDPERRYGFVALEDEGNKSVYFHIATVIKSGIAEESVVLGATVLCRVWHIREDGPEVKEFTDITKPSEPLAVRQRRFVERLPPPRGETPPPPRPVVRVSEPTLRPVEPAQPKTEAAKQEYVAAELVDEFGEKNKRRYPGGLPQLIIDELRKHRVVTRAQLSETLMNVGYKPQSLQSTLSEVHKRGWFIENGGRLYVRSGK